MKQRNGHLSPMLQDWKSCWNTEVSTWILNVEILQENPFVAYLEYDNVLVFETERAISSGLFMGTQKGSEMCKQLLAPYLENTYSKETETINSVMNKPII